MGRISLTVLLSCWEDTYVAGAADVIRFPMIRWKFQRRWHNKSQGNRKGKSHIGCKVAAEVWHTEIVPWNKEIENMNCESLGKPSFKKNSDFMKNFHKREGGVCSFSYSYSEI